MSFAENTVRMSTVRDCYLNCVISNKSTQLTSALVTRRVKPIDLLNRIPQLKLQCLFPNIIIAIRIFLTLPVTVATGERSFSKLSFIKNKLRNSSTQDRIV